MLKENTTLTSLDLSGEEKEINERRKRKREMMNGWQTIGSEMKEQKQ